MVTVLAPPTLGRDDAATCADVLCAVMVEVAVDVLAADGQRASDSLCAADRVNGQSSGRVRVRT